MAKAASIAGPNKLKIWQRRAVIDIGSNSVRLVIYDGPPRTPLSIFNEKALCGLGRREPGSNDILPEAMADALQTLRRFKAVWQQAGKPPISVFATAATRNASNGKAFVAEIENLGFDPAVLTGEEEAVFAALGVLSGAPDAIGREDKARPHYAGDMGGGSLELIRFSEDIDEPIQEKVSLPLGPFSLMAECGESRRKAEDLTKAHLGAHDWLAEYKADHFYAVGGAWRAIAKLHMAHHHYPLPILHHYQIARREIVDFCRFIEQQSEQSLKMMPGMQAKRIETLPLAAMVLRRVMQHIRARKLVLSAAGAREGMLFDRLTAEEKTRKPFERLAFEYGRRYSPEPEFGHEVYRLTGAIFNQETEHQRLVRHAACLMCDVASLHHPEMRAEYASAMALQSPFTGIDHAGRVALAATLYQRHFGRAVKVPAHLHPQLMPEGLATFARHVGMAIRFVADFSPKSAKSLKACHFTRENGLLVFTAPKKLEPLLGEMPSRRLHIFARELGVSAEMRFV